MATLPQGDLFRDGQSCSSACLHDSDSSQSAPSLQGRSHQFDPHTKMKETLEFLSAELNKLSVEERSKALNDVHCVGDEVMETEEMIEQSLTEFDQVVQTTAEPIYNVAVNQNRSYVEDPSFRLKFLWANRFNVRNSVNQMMSFLRQKALYFGEEKVAQDIVPEDMNTEEIALMRSGIFQIFKDRDHSGRVIFYNSSNGRMPARCNIETMVRVLYHVIFNMVIPIPSAQTKGVVIIYYDESKGENLESPGLSFRMKAHNFFVSLPIRISSLHVCVHSSPGSLTLHNNIARVTLKALSAHSVTRTRLHYGSDMERQYELRTFGIPLNSFPVDKNGNIRTDEIQMAWCDDYLENVSSTNMDLDASNENGAPHRVTNGILEQDILFGRGQVLQNHVGNVQFRAFLEERAEVYDSMPRYVRREACIRYTQELISFGSRFLRQTETKLWVECDFDQAVDKIAQFYRTRRRKNNKRQGEAGT